MPASRSLLLLTIAALVAIEFFQSSLLSFSAVYVSGGIGLTPEQFSFSAALYGGVAMLGISRHTWLRRHLGYRDMLLGALALFALGCVLAATARSPRAFFVARAVQALGGAHFFTGARVLMQRFPSAERGKALQIFVVGLTLPSAIGPWLAAWLLEHADFRLVLAAPLPLVLVVAFLVARTVDERRTKTEDHAHTGATLLLAGAVFVAEYFFDRTAYDFFASRSSMLVLVGCAIAGLALFAWYEHGRENGLLRLSEITRRRYLVGLGLYGLGYTTLAMAGYVVPIFLRRALGFPIVPTGAIVGATALMQLVAAMVAMAIAPRLRGQRVFLLVALGLLVAFGLRMSRVAPDEPLVHLVAPLLLLAAYGLLLQMTAAMFTFLEVDDDVFSHAYQTKNMLRELASSSGVSIAIILLRFRTGLHYERIAESITAETVTARAGRIVDGTSLAPLFFRRVAHQADFMACLDVFYALGIVGVAALLVALVQRDIA